MKNFFQKNIIAIVAICAFFAHVTYADEFDGFQPYAGNEFAGFQSYAGDDFSGFQPYNNSDFTGFQSYSGGDEFAGFQPYSNDSFAGFQPYANNDEFAGFQPYANNDEFAGFQPYNDYGSGYRYGYNGYGGYTGISSGNGSGRNCGGLFGRSCSGGYGGNYSVQPSYDRSPYASGGYGGASCGGLFQPACGSRGASITPSYDRSPYASGSNSGAPSCGGLFQQACGSRDIKIQPSYDKPIKYTANYDEPVCGMFQDCGNHKPITPSYDFSYNNYYDRDVPALFSSRDNRYTKRDYSQPATVAVVYPTERGSYCAETDSLACKIANSQYFKLSSLPRTGVDDPVMSLIIWLLVVIVAVIGVIKLSDKDTDTSGFAVAHE